MRSNTPIHLVDFVDEANLNEVRWNQPFLDEVKKDYGLKHGQAVVYCNAAQDRFRLVVCFYDMAVLMLPPVNPAERHSLYLKVSMFLRQFNAAAKLTKKLQSESEIAQTRIARRKKLATTAKRKRSR